MPVLSIIVPVYKVEKYLQKCIDSILNQTFRDFELILVDDGSPDNCPAICDAAAQKDARVVVVHQKNGGLSAARNAGLKVAKGEWIGFVDSDDYIAPEMYETLLARVQADNAEMAVCSYTYVDETGKDLGRTSPITKDEVLSREEMLRRMAGDKNWYYITAVNRLYKKALFANVEFPVGKLHEDQYTAHLFYWQCKRVSVVKKPLYFYVQRNASIMHTARKTVKIAEADTQLIRAKFALEHQLYELVASSCNGALGSIVPFEFQKGDKTEKDRAAIGKLKAETRNIVQQFLKEAPQKYRKQKAALGLFYVSPRLYYWALQAKQLKNR